MAQGTRRRIAALIAMFVFSILIALAYRRSLFLHGLRPMKCPIADSNLDTNSPIRGFAGSQSKCEQDWPPSFQGRRWMMTIASGELRKDTTVIHYDGTVSIRCWYWKDSRRPIRTAQFRLSSKEIRTIDAALAKLATHRLCELYLAKRMVDTGFIRMDLECDGWSGRVHCVGTYPHTFLRFHDAIAETVYCGHEREISEQFSDAAERP